MSVSPSDPSPGGTTLQFDTAESIASPQEMVCANCKAEITSVYHKLNQHVVCSRCRQAIEAKYEKGEGTPAGRFAKALLFGGAGALAGAVIYGLVLIFAGGWSLVAAVVGFLVGKGVRKGSGNRGGPKYQALAMVLTYLAIGLCYVPTVMAVEDPPSVPAAAQSQPAASSVDKPGATASAPSPPAEGVKPKAERSHVPPAVAFVVGLTYLAVAAPFFLLKHGEVLSVIIIAIGLYEAWRLNKKLVLPFLGPIQLPASVAPAAVPAGE